MTSIDNMRLPAENRLEVEARANKAIDAALLAIGAHDLDAVVIKRLIGSAYPAFCGQMHEERANGTPAAVVRTACDILLVNILYEIVVSLTTPNKRADVLRDIVKKARGSVLDAIGGARQDSSEAAPLSNGSIDSLLPGADDLAVAMHRAMTARHPSGTVGVRLVTAACGSIAGSYLAALPEHLRDDEVERFCMRVREIVAGAGQ